MNPAMQVEEFFFLSFGRFGVFQSIINTTTPFHLKLNTTQ